MLVASDLDGTIDADPSVFVALFDALHQAGHTIVILTGAPDPVDQTAVQAKQERLAQLGIGQYAQLVVFPRDNISDAKAKWCKQHGVDLLIDNLKPTARAASKVALVLVPWATRTK